MFDKLSKDEFRYFLVNAKREISYILDLLDDEDALDILTYIHYDPVTFKDLKSFFDKIGINMLSNYITTFWDFGVIEMNRKEEYQLTKLGRKFLEITVQFVLEALLSKEITDERMKKILVQKIGENELEKFKRAKEDRKAKGIQVKFVRGP
ncbi:MAG: hypothetical protein GPJ51_11310 [Candidatus Heimdallarchaeota archaeon]|nr:hypothetical protein [Candidatus Heimdallarchaeota archaeon]